MIALQSRRLQRPEPRDADYLFRQMADFQYLIVARWRLRRPALVALSVPTVRDDVTAAIARFDAALPGLKRMRDVGEHAEDYAIDNPKRHDKPITRRQLQVAGWSENEFTWLGERLKVEAALDAAAELYRALKEGQRRVDGTVV
jgi:hypothetical protein